MANDTYTWELTGFPHKSSVDALRTDIIFAHANQSPFPISIVVDLLPLQSDQLDEVARRGNFLISGDAFSNEADTELVVTLEDPAIETFFVTLPSIWSGRLHVAGDELEIVFDPALELEVPRLETLGVNRSKYQLVTSIACSPARAVTTLQDKISQGAETLIDVLLDPDAEAAMSVRRAATSAMATIMSSKCTSGEPDDPNWYVYRRRNDGICIIHYGSIVYGANAYDWRFGPATYDACVRHEQNDPLCI